MCPLVQVHLEEMDVEEETIKQRRRIYVSCNLCVCVWGGGGGACDTASGGSHSMLSLDSWCL